MSTTKDSCSAGTTAFHAWLLEQAARDDAVGDLARDYQTGTEQGVHEPAEDPDDLIEILEDHRASVRAVQTAFRARTEWERLTPPHG